MGRLGGVRSRVSRRCSAFTLVEVCVAAAVLTIALSGMVGSLIASMTLQRVNRETALAEQSARRVLEELQSLPFEEILATYDTSTANDAGLAVPARGANFAVAGLSAQEDDADGLCGEVQFPVVSVGGLPRLREDVVDGALGMPRDLNADGVVDALDHSADYLLLPVRVRVAWRGASGDRQLELATVMCRR